ncbi:DUF2490 domain-containing protein [Caulobacter segnis]|uniref:DUF2490 domain-containing protein n=1 Tax=Caulobacter segnis TaxID=88688 RepID=UPI00240F5D76|nr:DUF2490 domain-containing protein [Caulobacter segnis]MDG2520407.1 DUF2490 domain-containing protein [Caulobacter segnis]
MHSPHLASRPARRGHASGRTIVLAALVSLAATPALAAEEDFQSWLSATGTTAISPKIDATMEAHFRFYDDASYLGQLLLRPSLTYKLEGGWSLSGGYAYARTDPGSADVSHEHRAWEQVGYRFVGDERLTITGRTRLEQRFVEGRDGTGWRVRQQVRAAFTSSGAGKVQAVAWNETFYSLNDTVFGQRAGFDQTRTFIGASLPLARGTTIEPGYLNHRTFREGPDRVNHILAVNLFTRF